MKLDKIDALVAAVTAATLIAAVGMLFDIWQAVYYSIPVFVLLFMLLGSLNARDAWSTRTLVPVVAFGLVVTALFVAAGVLIDSTETLGGLPVSTAIFLYVLWPLSVVGGPLVYALVYRSWLAKDVRRALPS